MAQSPYPDYSGPCYSRSLSTVKDGEMSKPLLLKNHSDHPSKIPTSQHEVLGNSNGGRSSLINDFKNDNQTLPLAKPARKSTQREIILILVCLSLLVILLIVSITMIKCLIVNEDPSMGVFDNRILYCLTASCLRATAEISEIMSDGKKGLQFACENLEEFACGEWIKTSRLPPTNIVWNLVEEIRHTQFEGIRNLLESDFGNISSNGFLWKFQITFEKCMKRHSEFLGRSCDKDTATDSTVDELLKMPNLQLDSVDKILQHVQVSLNVPIFFKTSVVRDYSRDTNDTENSIIMLSEFEADGLPDNIELQDPAVITKLTEYINAISMAAGLSKTQIEHLPEDAISTLRKLRRASYQPIERLKLNPELSEVKVNVSELISLTKHTIDFLKYLTFFSKINMKEFTVGSEILLSNIEYFKELSSIVLQSKLSNLKNFILFSVIHKYGSFVSQTFSNAKQSFLWRDTGRQHHSESWQDCIELLNSPGIAGLHQLSMKKKPNFELAIKRIQGSILFYIRRSLVTIISRLKMRDSDKEIILEKISSVKLITQNLTTPFLDEYYKNWRVEKNSSLLQIIKDFETLNLKTVSPMDIVMKISNGLSSHSSLSTYIPEINSLIISNILLQWPFYSPDESIPRYLEFASLGLWLAYPMLEILGYKASIFSTNGSLLKSPINLTLEDIDTKSLLDEVPNEEFITFIKKYQNKEVVRSILSIVLLESSYDNYQKEVYSKEHVLPHLNYSAKQILFIKIAQNFCSKHRPEYQSQMDSKNLLTSKDNLELISNMKSFKDVYKC